MADVYLTLEPQEAKVSHKWRTAIQKVVLGFETRTALFTWPRVMLSNKYTPSGSAQINWLKRNLIFNTDKIWGIPVWPDKTILTGEAASGQPVMAVGQTDYRHFYAGRLCIIIAAADPFTYEIGIIDTLGSAEITLTENLAAAWPAGSLVLPLYECRIPGNQSVSGADQQRQTFDVEATEAFEEQREFVYTPPVSGAAQYLDIDLLLFPLQKPVTYDFARPYDMQQFLGLGYAASRYAAGDNALALKAQFLFPTRPQIQGIWDFFDSKMGRLESLWLPSWNRDIVPTLPIGAEDTEITIEPLEYGATYLSNEILGRYLFIRFPDRSYVCRKIIDAAGDYIVLDSAPGKAVTAGQLPRLSISFLYLCRFDLDEMEISYPKGRPDFGQAELSFAALMGEDLTELVSGDSKGYFSGGYDDMGYYIDLIDALQFSDETVAALSAVLSVARGELTGVNSALKGYFGGGSADEGNSDLIDALQFSDETVAPLSAVLSVARYGVAGVNSALKGYFGGGYADEGNSDLIDALQFSDETVAPLSAVLSVTRSYPAGVSYNL